MTQNNAVTQNAVGFVPCLQCAPAESSPDGTAQCRPEICPRYQTIVSQPPAKARPPATKRNRPPFTPRRVGCHNPRWTYRKRTMPTQSRKHCDNNRKL